MSVRNRFKAPLYKYINVIKNTLYLFAAKSVGMQIIIIVEINSLVSADLHFA